METMSVTTARKTESPWRLLAQAAGSPRQLADKLARLARGVTAYADGAALDARLARLHARGILDEIPGRWQIVAGAVDMLRFWITPAARDYYDQQGINFTFHQVLRFLDEPASLGDPVGFFSTRVPRQISTGTSSTVSANASSVACTPGSVSTSRYA